MEALPGPGGVQAPRLASGGKKIVLDRWFPLNNAQGYPHRVGRSAHEAGLAGPPPGLFADSDSAVLVRGRPPDVGPLRDKERRCDTSRICRTWPQGSGTLLRAELHVFVDRPCSCH